MSGRAKFFIKQKGYQVFPDDVQAYIAEHPSVEQVDVVGVKHELFDEGISAFVKFKKGVSVETSVLMEHCKGLATYKRPQHYENWPEADQFPINRTTKVDKMVLKGIAEDVVTNLRKAGKWDKKQG